MINTTLGGIIIPSPPAEATEPVAEPTEPAVEEGVHADGELEAERREPTSDRGEPVGEDHTSDHHQENGAEGAVKVRTLRYLWIGVNKLMLPWMMVPKEATITHTCRVGAITETGKFYFV